MHLSQEEFVVNRLSPIQSRLFSVVRQAFDAYFQKYKETLKDHPPGTQAHLINLELARETEEYFRSLNEPGIYITTKYRRLFVNYKNTAVFCVKKFGKGLRVASNTTKQSESFDNQVALEGMPEGAPNLYLGYKLGATRFDLESVWIVCPSGKSSPHYWAWNISHDNPNYVPIELPLEVQNPDTGRRIRIKGGKNQNQQENQ
jgi:hypothetical protein